MTTIEDVKSRGYTHCTIDSGMYGTFLAKVEYQDACRAWNPVEVLFEGKWISIDEFDDMDGFNAYGCKDYRQEALTPRQKAEGRAHNRESAIDRMLEDFSF